MSRVVLFQAGVDLSKRDSNVSGSDKVIVEGLVETAAEKAALVAALALSNVQTRVRFALNSRPIVAGDNYRGWVHSRCTAFMGVAPSGGGLFYQFQKLKQLVTRPNQFHVTPNSPQSLTPDNLQRVTSPSARGYAAYRMTARESRTRPFVKMGNLATCPNGKPHSKQTEVGTCMRGRGSVILEEDECLEVDYEVNEQRRHLPTGSGTWLASVKSYAGTINPVPSASPKPYTLELSNGQRIRFRSDGTTVTFSGELFSGDES